MPLPAPLDDAARQLLLRELPVSVRRTPGLLDDDLDVLAVLTDIGEPRCIVSRDDLSYSAWRTLAIARRPTTLIPPPTPSRSRQAVMLTYPGLVFGIATLVWALIRLWMAQQEAVRLRVGADMGPLDRET